VLPIVTAIVVLAVIAMGIASIRIAREYERGVMFRLGP